MQATIQTKAFSQAVGLAARVAASQASLPILKSVLLEASEGGLRIAATDLEATLDMTVIATVGEPGSVSVPAKTLAALLAGAGAEQMELRKKLDQLLISSSRGEYSLAGLPAEDYPAIGAPTTENNISLEAALLREVLNQVGAFPDPKDSRASHSCVRLLAKDGRLLLNGFSGFAYARREIDLAETTADYDVLLPAVSALEMAQLLGSAREQCELSVNTHQSTLHFDGTLYTARLMDGKYPNYEKLLGERPAHRIVVDREELLAALKRLSLFKVPSEILQRVEFTFGAQTLSLSTSTEVGEASEELAISRTSEVLLKLDASQSLVADLLRSMTSGEVAFWVNEKQPTGVCCEPVDSSNYQAWFQPLSLQ